jgi:vancomycin resistance protein YoaR
VNGAKLDVDAAIAAIKSQTLTDNRQVSLPITTINPLVRAEDTSALVIKDLIEEDSTSYAGSIPERAHNVELAASRLNGVVVGPGQTFSFNDEVGQVTLASGYQIGYGITVSGTDMITVPSEGGGICQVATTLFHPVFWAGYPIKERIGHLYWIPKYGTPPKGMQGLDATVDTAYDKDGKLLYSVDFKFENNTENAVLIQSRTANDKVYFQLWGVKPDWEVKVDGPVITDVVKANPEQVKQEDPTMAAGKTLWVEEARDGFKSVITRTVSKGGKVLQTQQIISRYNASRNVLLVGTKGAPPAPAGTPTASTTKTPVPAGTAAPAPAATKAPAAAATPTKAPAAAATKTP